jgi:hypothetical protein
VPALVVVEVLVLLVEVVGGTVEVLVLVEVVGGTVEVLVLLVEVEVLVEVVGGTVEVLVLLVEVEVLVEVDVVAELQVAQSKNGVPHIPLETAEPVDSPINSQQTFPSNIPD